MDYLDKPDPQTFIAHHGIKGQKWGFLSPVPRMRTVA